MTTGELEELLADVVDRHRHPIPPDPLHERARAAIERLGLDGARLKLAVAVFGWGSDEANGSLLGLVRTLYDAPTAVVSWIGGGFLLSASAPDPELHIVLGGDDISTEEAYVRCLEIRSLALEARAR